jgi:hypothetical protein
MLVLIRVNSCNTPTATTAQVAERQRELECARELVKFEHTLQEQAIAAEALRCEAEVQRNVAAELRSTALERVRVATRSAAAAAANDQARHLSDLEAHRPVSSSSNSSTVTDDSASSSNASSNSSTSSTSSGSCAQ